jgi:hypothetical protein
VFGGVNYESFDIHMKNVFLSFDVIVDFDDDHVASD